VDGLSAFGAASVSLVFGVAALGKVVDRASFVRALRNQGLTSRPVRRAAAVAIPLSELGCAIALWIPAVRRPAAVVAALMLAAFSVVLVRSIVIGVKGGCGCFGSSTNDRVSWLSVARNAVLIVLALTAAVPETDGFGPTAAILAGMGIGVLVLVVDLGAAVLARNWARPSGSVVRNN
jgi:hypothetical protein